MNTTLTAHTGSLPTAGPAVSATGSAVDAAGSGASAAPDRTSASGAASAASGHAGGFGGFGGQGATQGGATQGGARVRRLRRAAVRWRPARRRHDRVLALTQALQANASGYTWAAAAVGSQNAASYQLASGEAVMPLGGFNGSDPSPTLAQFEQDVSQGKIHYFIASGGIGRSNGGSSDASAISAGSSRTSPRARSAA